MSSAARVASLVASWSAKVKQQSRSFASQASAAASQAATPASQTATTAFAAGRSVADLSNEEILYLLKTGAMSPHKLESDLGDATRAVHLRRSYIADQLAKASGSTKVTTKGGEAMSKLPSEAFDTGNFYNSILNTNCEAVIGYVPLPVGVVGPLVLDGKHYYVPMATTEGALVASTNRGCAAIRRAGGASTAILADGMTRAPLVRMPNMPEAARLKAWIETPEHFAQVAAAFNSTSRFGRLKTIQVALAGRNVYLRFKCFTGDAMGMNMITKGVNEALMLLSKHFPDMKVLSLSGNFCTDKKPSAVNWIEGRGKSVTAEVRLSGHIIKTVLKTSADAMVELNTAKNLVGSALAGSIGGFNAHASNILTAVYLATGQDPAQNVESSTCLTLMERDDTIVDPADPEGKSGPGLIMTVNMPSVEVGTVGGGTSLPAQSAALELLGLKGSSQERPGANSERLARVVAGSVLAGELSLMSALTTNDLLKSHMKLNRKPAEGDSGPTTLMINENMAAKLREFNSASSAGAATSVATGPSRYYTATYTSAASEGASGSLSADSVSFPVAAGAVSGLPRSSSSAVKAATGAPAGSHPHPLHMAGSSSSAAIPASSTSLPGRRYFAAPTATSRPVSVTFQAAARSVSNFQPASNSIFANMFAGEEVRAFGKGTAAAWSDNDEPCLPVP